MRRVVERSSKRYVVLGITAVFVIAFLYSMSGSISTNDSDEKDTNYKTFSTSSQQTTQPQKTESTKTQIQTNPSTKSSSTSQPQSTEPSGPVEVIKKEHILEFSIPFLFRNEISSYVSGFGFTKQELILLMEEDSADSFSFKEEPWRESLKDDKKSILFIDWETVKRTIEPSESLLSLLKIVDKQVNHYIAIFLDFKENSTEEEHLFQFMQHHRVWDFEYTNRIITVDGAIHIQRHNIERLKHLDLVLLHSQGYNSEVAKVFQYLDRLQYPENCSKVVWAAHPHYACGLACIIHFMQYALTWTTIHNYTLAVIQGGFGYAGAPCIYKDYRCQFIPIPLGCPFDMTKDRWIQHGYELPVTGLPIEGPYSPDNNKNITAFWWRMALENYLIRPNPTLYRKTRYSVEWLNARSKTGSMFPCISMHVRRGDKKFEHAPTADDVYVNALVEYQKKRKEEKLPDITNVFIMTDDEYFIGNISALVPSNKYFLLDIPRSEIKPIVGGYGQGLDVMVESYIAAKCSHFIGTFSSNVGRLIAEINSLDGFTSQSLDSGWHMAP